MRRAAIVMGFASALAIASNAAGEVSKDRPATYPIPYAAQVGKAWTIEIRRTKERLIDGKTTTTVADITARYEIVEKINDGFIAEWTTTSIEVGGVRFGPDRPKPELLLGVPISIQIQSDGLPIGLMDWPGLLDKVIAGLGKLDRYRDSKESLDGTRKMLGRWTSQQAVESMFVEPMTISSCQNTDLPIGRPIRSEQPIDDPFGGKDIPTTVTFTLVSLDRDTGVAAIRAVQELDITSAMENLVAQLREIRPDMTEAEIAKRFKGATGSRTMTTSCIVDLESGEARKVDFVTRSVVRGGGENLLEVDRREMSITPASR